MKYIIGFSWISLISMLGEILHTILPIPIPAGIYGMVILLITLKFNIVKLETVKEMGKFLLDNISIMFIPATVGIFYCIEELMTMLLPILISVVIITPLVMGISGIAVQKCIDKGAKHESDD